MLSIVIITKDRANELKNAIFSCLQNIHTEKEFIIIDNGSDHETPALIEHIQMMYPNELFVYEKEEENLGVSGGRNHGWNLASGEFVLFLDDDAVIEKVFGSFHEILTIFEQYPEVSILALRVYDPEYNLYLQPRLFRSEYEQALFFIGAGHIIYKSRFNFNKLYPEALMYGHEDLFLSLRNYQLGYRIYYERRILVYHFPSRIRAAFSEEKTNGIVNKYIVKRCFFPRAFYPILYLGFLRRNLLFWKNFGETFRCHSIAAERRKRIGYYKKLSFRQAFALLNEFGGDFLWEISHNNSDKKLIRKENSV